MCVVANEQAICDTDQMNRPPGVLVDAEQILVITGAGISAESGLPTFRDPDGWWNRINPEELATRAAFDRDPVQVWRWYEHRRSQLASVDVNAAHRALARAEDQGRRVAIVTQNVDDLHERAGSREVVHVHGNLWELRCLRDGTVFEDRRVPLPSLPPKCACGSVARPNIVWFDENLDPDVVARVDALVSESFDTVLVIGTEATFDYIVHWALTATRRGAKLIEVNPRETPLTQHAHMHIAARAGEVLDAAFSG